MYAPADTTYAPRLALYFGALFLIFGVHLPYLPVWLDWQGLDAREIAWITAAPLFLRIAVTPAVAYFADRHLAYREVVITLSGVALFLTALLSAATSLPAIAVLAIALAIIMTTISPLAETLAVAGMRSGRLDYGRTRLWGSLTFIIAGVVGGLAIGHAGAGVVIWLLVGAAALTAAAAYLLPRGNRPLALAVAPLSVRDSLALAGSPIFILFLLTGGAIQGSHAFFYSFGAIELGRQGLSPAWIGALWAIAVGAEVALFVFARPVMLRAGAVGLLLLGGAAGVIRWTVMAFDPPLGALIVLQLLHGLTFSAAHLGAIEFMRTAVPERFAATAQALYISVAAGLVFGAATLASGSSYAAYEGSGYIGMAALALVGVVGTLVLRAWTEHTEPSAITPRVRDPAPVHSPSK